MIRYLICIGLCAIVWIVNIKEIIHAAKNRMPSEIFIHAGLGLFFSIIIIEWTLGAFGYWERLNIFLLKIIGFLLFIPSACFCGFRHLWYCSPANDIGHGNWVHRIDFSFSVCSITPIRLGVRSLFLVVCHKRKRTQYF